MNNPLETEVGGTHYQKYVMQPVELFMACGWNYCQSNIAKYVLRHQDKNGKEDLEKSLHISKIGTYYDASSMYDASAMLDVPHKPIIATFARVNNLDMRIAAMLYDIDCKDYQHVHATITYMIEELYN